MQVNMKTTHTKFASEVDTAPLNSTLEQEDKRMNKI